MVGISPVGIARKEAKNPRKRDSNAVVSKVVKKDLLTRFQGAVVKSREKTNPANQVHRRGEADADARQQLAKEKIEKWEKTKEEATTST